MYSHHHRLQTSNRSLCSFQEKAADDDVGHFKALKNAEN
jgi:hypothetical protein